MLDLTASLAWAQGIYFLLTGIWPIIHLQSFMKVTGPKTDTWLVQTVGALIGVIAMVLLVAAWRRSVEWPVLVLAIGSAAALTLVDIVFVAKRRISPIYLADAAIEMVLIAGWGLGLHGQMTSIVCGQSDIGQKDYQVILLVNCIPKFLLRSTIICFSLLIFR